MPHGWRKVSRSVPKRSMRSCSTPASLKRSAQNPIESAGTERFMLFAWLVPRLPIHPAWR